MKRYFLSKSVYAPYFEYLEYKINAIVRQIITPRATSGQTHLGIDLSSVSLGDGVGDVVTVADPTVASSKSKCI